MNAAILQYRLPTRASQRQLLLRIEQALLDLPALSHLSVLPPPQLVDESPGQESQMPVTSKQLQLDLDNPDRQAALQELLETRFRLNLGVLLELEILRAALLHKPDLFSSWFRHLTDCAIREGVEQSQAERTAQRIMETLFQLKITLPSTPAAG